MSVDVDRVAQRRRWMARHGAVRLLANRRARAGVPGARLMVGAERGETPWAVWELMRAEYPFAEGPVPEVLITVHHDVARTVLTSDAFEMPHSGSVPEPGEQRGPLAPPSLLAVDGAEHTRLRRLMAHTFAARAVTGWTDIADRIATELIDGLIARTAPGDVVDLVRDWAVVIPARVITSMLGLPLDEVPDLPRWTESAAMTLDLGLSWERYVTMESDLALARDWLSGEIAHRRRNLGDDLVSHLIRNGNDDDALVVIMMLVVTAGIDTSTHLLSAAADTLIARPDVAAALRAEPELLPAAVEELLRLQPPATQAVRRAARDVELHGATVRRGQLVIVCTGAANRDPAVFPDPLTFDLTRPNARAHLSFGLGVHHCLGAALARVEGLAGLRVLADRVDAFEPAGPTPWRPTQLVRGRATLPVRLIPTGSTSPG